MVHHSLPLCREMAEALVRSVAARNLHLLSRERARLQQQRQRELLRRKEAHADLLALLPVGDWKDMLREHPPSFTTA